MSILLENEAMSQLLNNINIEKKDNDKSNKNKIKCEKNCCIAAVKYNTIGNAYKDIQNNVLVYLIVEKKNDVSKKYAYSRCAKTTHDGNDYCHLHTRMIKHNIDGLKIFEKDILPKDLNDKTRWLAHINDDFFENMGKRGAKKKNCENNYTFSDSNNPILLVLNHKNPKLLTYLSIYASQLLKGNYTIIQNDTPNSKLSSSKNKPHKIDNEISNLDNIISMISSMDEKNINKLIKKNNLLQKKSCNDESSSEEVLSDNNEELNDFNQDNLEKLNENNFVKNDIINNNNNNNINQKSDIDSDIDSDSNDDSDDEESDGISCIPIYTLKKRMLWLNPDNDTVYEPEGDDGGAEIGILKEISIDYHTIFYKEKYYTVLKELNDKKYGKIFCCSLTDKLFNKKLKHIGIKKKLKNNEYQLNFLNEI